MADFGKIALGVRIGHNPNAAMFCCWTELLLHGRPGDVVMRPAMHFPHSCSANILAGQFLETTDCDTLCFIDDDMTFAPDTLERLRADDGGHSILSVLYPTRRHPYAPIAFRRNPTSDNPDAMEEIQPTGAGIVTADLVGLGFTLVRRDCLAPNCFEWSNLYGEDGMFCRRVQAMGKTIGVNLSVRCGHRTEITVQCKLAEARE